MGEVPGRKRQDGGGVRRLARLLLGPQVCAVDGGFRIVAGERGHADPNQLQQLGDFEDRWNGNVPRHVHEVGAINAALNTSP